MTVDQPSRELLILFRDGDAAAFAEIFRAYHRASWRVAARFFRDEIGREEAVQEIWLTIHRNRAIVDPERASAFAGFLATTARNRCVDLLRARGGRTEAFEVELPGEGAELVAPEPEPDELAQAAQLGAELARFKASLPQQLLRAYELLFEQELEPAAAGRASGLSRIRMRYLKKLLLARLRADSGLLAALGGGGEAAAGAPASDAPGADACSGGGRRR